MATTLRATLSCLVSTLPLIAQATPPTPAPSLLPLLEGAHWTYEHGVGIADGPPIVHVTDEGGFAMPDGTRIHQLRIDREGGPAPQFEYWSVRADGIYQHATRAPGQRGAIVADAPPLRLLALPLGQSRAWTWRGPLPSLQRDAHEWDHRAEVVDPAATIEVPAGTFTATHVRIVSERDGVEPLGRELWFAPGVGIVREQQLGKPPGLPWQLAKFEPGRPTRQERLLRHLDQQLADPTFPAFNNPPWIGWIDAGPEAMVLPGRIAVVKAERWCRCFYVDGDGVHAFEPREADRTAVAARAAFGATNPIAHGNVKTAIPPADVSVVALAQLLARTEAERRHLARLRFVAPTLTPERALPTDRRRHAHVELEGGALDGTTRRVAVWLTIDRSSDIQIVTDAPDPWPKK